LSAVLPPTTLPWRVPLVPEPPHDPTSLLLSGCVGPRPEIGWALGKLDGLELGAGAPALVLQPSPGALRRMSEPSGSFGGLRMPLNSALGPAGDVYLLDPLTAQLKRFDPCDCAFSPVPCFLPHGELRGIAICGGDLYVADGSRAQVLRYAMNGFLARAALRLPRAEAKQLGRPWSPFAIAFDGRGRLYVSDPRNVRIDVFDAQGRWRGAHATSAPPWLLALDCRDRLYAVLAQVGELALATPNDGYGARWSWSADVAGLAIVVLEDAFRTLDERTVRPADFARPPMPIDARGELHLPCTQAGAGGEALFDARGLRLRPESRALEEIYLRKGEYRSRALDSGIEGCQWHRVELRGALADGCAVRVRTLSAHVELGEQDLALLPEEAWSEGGWAAAMDADGRWDCLVKSPPGRFLWLRLGLSGDGHATPALDAVMLEFPRLGLRRYLPAVFGADPAGADFTDRFSALFDTTLRSIERRLDRLAALFDPRSAPAERKPGRPDFLSWLASWIGLALARDWPEARQRRYVREAARLYCLRGTPLGLWRQLLLFLGLDQPRCPAERPVRRCIPVPLNCASRPAKTAVAPPPLILEHFKLRRWLHAGRGRLGEDSMLWGQKIVNRTQLSAGAQVGATTLTSRPDPLRDPFHVYAHRFSVFVPARVEKSDGERRALEQLLAREVPAHTLYDVRYVEPRFRVGVQAMLGLDSVIARTPKDVFLGQSTLGRGSLLSPPPARRGGPRLRVGEARVGSTTVLT
jgi:phage tail-like protein